MKIAICFSGQLRTGIRCADNFKKYIGKLWDNCDFFIHTWDMNSYSSPGFSSKAYDAAGIKPYELMPVNLDEVYNFAKIYKPKSMVCASFRQWEEMDFRTSFDPHLYSVRQANILKQNYENEMHFKYNFVVRTRPDMIFDPKKSLEDDIAELTLDRTFAYAQIYDAVVIYNKIDNGFWLGSSYVMDQVCNFEQIKGNVHPIISVDGQMQFGNWVMLGLCFNVKKLANSRIAVYRQFHDELGKDPIKDFQYVFDTISRPNQE